MPYHAYFYIQVVNQTVNFQIDWKSVFHTIGINFDPMSLFNKESIKIPSLPTNLQRAGIKSLSILSQMSNVLIVIVIFVLLRIFAPLFTQFKSKDKWFFKYMKSTFDDFKFNGLIRTITVGFLD